MYRMASFVTLKSLCFREGAGIKRELYCFCRDMAIAFLRSLIRLPNRSKLCCSYFLSHVCDLCFFYITFYSCQPHTSVYIHRNTSKAYVSIPSTYFYEMKSKLLYFFSFLWSNSTFTTHNHVQICNLFQWFFMYS